MWSPHEISPLNEPIEFFLRVQRPAEDVIVDVAESGRLESEPVRPSEMLNIKLTRAAGEIQWRYLRDQVKSRKGGWNSVHKTIEVCHCLPR